MRRLRTLSTPVVILVCVAALAGCGRKTVPVATRADGTPARVVVPAADGTARLPRVAPVTSDLSVLPTEITRNPNAEKKRFPLDGLLN
ncbi:hypothetical protein [Aureimonas jatrophae]|uniref:Lipoprotein-attachment site-containing protein n=1 Tax=Aureimonas jatrophae TaxID=1166073 RepID=A0A1H0ICQ0_9HYPH|nr:hypothetical protein [Aureimonas jatrophae]MBB3952096.1 uncharacterized lipoprotein YehR (DUF1307 family) [Aureimonas jatrophae]SDO29163.1 hypothetical protein SAMN05192530_10571 [Aureimonas jatrophae]